MRQGIYAMYAGNGDQTKSMSSRLDVNVKDVGAFLDELGDNSTYLRMDLNLDGDVNVHDLSLILQNQGVFSAIEFEFENCSDDLTIALPEHDAIEGCDLSNFEVPEAFVLEGCDTIGVATSKILEDSSCYKEILLTPLETTSQQAKINCDGSIIAWYTRRYEKGYIYILKNNQDTIKVETPSKNTRTIVMSDNGTLVWRDEDTADIFMSEEGSEPVLISTTTNYNQQPAISRDGSTIVWSGSIPEIGGRIIKFVLGSHSDPEVFTSRYGYNPKLNCDGSVLTFSGTGDQSQQNIFRKVRNEPSVEISLTSDNNANPKISCDGSTVIWNASTNFDKEIFASIDGDLPIKLSTTSIKNINPSMSLDGSIIVWEGEENNDVLAKHQVYKAELIELISTRLGPTEKSFSEPIRISDIDIHSGFPQVSADNSTIIWRSEGNIKRLREGAEVTNVILSQTTSGSNFNAVMDCAGVNIVWRRGIHSASFPIVMSSCNDKYPECPPVQFAIEYSHSDSTISFKDTAYFPTIPLLSSAILCPDLLPIPACQLTTYSPPDAIVNLSCGGTDIAKGEVVYESVDCFGESVIIEYKYRDRCGLLIKECTLTIQEVPIQFITCPTPLKVTACNYLRYEAAPATVVLGCGDTVQVEAKIIENTFDNSNCIEATAVNVAEGQNRLRDPKVSCDGATIMWNGKEIDSLRSKLYRSVGFSSFDQISHNGNSASLGDMDCSGTRFVWTHQTQEFGTDIYIYDQDSVFHLRTEEVDRSPKVSCDGSTFTWHALIPGTDSSVIYKLLFGDTVAQKITTARGGYEPSINCDGSAIVWSAVDVMGGVQIYKSENSSQPIQITNSQSNSLEPIISCDGSTITWSERNGPDYRGVFTSFDGNRPVNMSSYIFSAQFYDMPCDGQSVYWSGQDSNDIRQIFKSFPDGSFEQITNVLIGSGPFYPKVSCDGSALVWVDRPVSNQTILYLQYSGGKPIPLFSSPYIIQQPSISCDAGTIAFRINESEIYGINCSLLEDCLTGTITLQYSIKSACGIIIEECVVDI